MLAGRFDASDHTLDALLGVVRLGHGRIDVTLDLLDEAFVTLSGFAHSVHGILKSSNAALRGFELSPPFLNTDHERGLCFQCSDSTVTVSQQIFDLLGSFSGAAGVGSGFVDQLTENINGASNLAVAVKRRFKLALEAINAGYGKGHSVFECQSPLGLCCCARSQLATEALLVVINRTNERRQACRVPFDGLPETLHRGGQLRLKTPRFGVPHVVHQSAHGTGNNIHFFGNGLPGLQQFLLLFPIHLCEAHQFNIKTMLELRLLALHRLSSFRPG